MAPETQTGADRDTIKQLSRICSPDRVSAAEVDRLTYAYDATRREHPPAVVAWPESEDEISAIMKLANERGIPVYPRGGGTGLTGGALAVRGGVLLSFERMASIVSLDGQNRLVTAQPGIRLGDLKAAVQKEGLFFPPDPSSAKTAELGGCLAECAGGLNCVKYGTIKDWVQALRAVLPTGEIVKTGARVRKSVVGYNLTQLLVGSEGTLGLITEATLRLVPHPPLRSAFIALFDSAAASARASVAMLGSGAVPSAMEFIDRLSLEAAAAYMPDSPIPIAEALLLVECDGFEPGPVNKDIETLQAVCRDNGATSVQSARSEEEREALWSIRRALSPAMHAKAHHKTNEDICVPISGFPGILEDAYAIGRRHNVLTLCFGHAGDGNIHVNFMSDKMPDPDVERAVGELFEATVRRGGSISGEHGIGIMKAPYLHLELGENERRLHRDIKNLFDPKGVLNPGKFIEYC